MSIIFSFVRYVSFPRSPSDEIPELLGRFDFEMNVPFPTMYATGATAERVTSRSHQASYSMLIKDM